MVWIHGGAYSGGNTRGFDGTPHVEAARGDIVWVTIEYRLNVFGFLGSQMLKSRDAQLSTGNYGLQDQRLALEWVQRNIKAFGGDPANVMIDGCSAGAGSTANHVVNAHSWPFFHKAAGESGTAVEPGVALDLGVIIEPGVVADPGVVAELNPE